MIKNGQLRIITDSLEKHNIEIGLVYKDIPQDSSVDVVNEIRNYIGDLNKISGLPTRLREVGVEKRDFEIIAKTAINDGAAIVNPVEVTFERVMNILNKAY